VQPIEAFLFNPVTGLGVALLVAIFGPKLAGSSIWLFVAWLLFIVSIYRVPSLAHQSFVPRALVTMFFGSLIGLGLCLLSGWRPATSGEGIEPDSDQKRDSVQIQTMQPAIDSVTIHALVKAFKEEVNQQARTFSNRELSQSAIAFSKRMRAFERKFKEQQDAATLRWMRASRDNPDSAWHAQTEEMTRMYFDKQQEFRDTLLGQAVYLKNELEQRLSIKLDPSEEANLLAFRGMLAGVSPVADAADYLEKLAHRLTPPSSSSAP